MFDHRSSFPSHYLSNHLSCLHWQRQLPSLVHNDDTLKLKSIEGRGQTPQTSLNSVCQAQPPVPSGTLPEAWGIAGPRAAKVSSKAKSCRLGVFVDIFEGRSRDGLYEPALADSEREAVADLLQYLENVGGTATYHGQIN